MQDPNKRAGKGPQEPLNAQACLSDERIWALAQGEGASQAQECFEVHRRKCPQCTALWEMARGLLDTEITAEDLAGHAWDFETPVQEVAKTQPTLPSWDLPQDLWERASIYPVAVEVHATPAANDQDATKPKHAVHQAVNCASVVALRPRRSRAVGPGQDREHLGLRTLKLCGSTAMLVLALSGLHGTIADHAGPGASLAQQGVDVRSEIRPSFPATTFAVEVKELRMAKGFSPEQLEKIQALQAMRGDPDSPQVD